MNEETYEQNKNLIAKATASGYVTLLTRDFCRGTDFKCVDDVVQNNGGVHVIQTYLASSKSEE